jgi:hypothetical protein
MLQSPNEFSGANWQLLGEIELPHDSIAGDLIQTWLFETLRPLNLNERFLKKFLASARHEVERDIQSESSKDYGQFHVLLFAPGIRQNKDQSWGFCRIDKMEHRPTDNNTSVRVIEFYLYPEG